MSNIESGLPPTSDTAKATRYMSFIAHDVAKPNTGERPLFSWLRASEPLGDGAPASPEEIAQAVRHRIVKELRLHPQSIGVVYVAELVANAAVHNTIRRVEIRSAQDLLVCEVYDDGDAGQRQVVRPDEGGLGLGIIALTTELYGRDENVSWCAFPPEFQDAA